MITPALLFIVILAGGKGERLWPLSRQLRPKQFLPFQGSTSLLETTIARIAPLAPPSQRILVTTQELQNKIPQTTASEIGLILSEPEGRNTAAAIALVTLALKKLHPQAHLVFLPADHAINDEEQFRQDLTTAINSSAADNSITLLGLKPLYPATGYGYIEYHQNSDDQKNTPLDQAHPVKKFHEKPSLSTATGYLQNPFMLWNLGIFCGPLAVFDQELKKHAPEVHEAMEKYLNSTASYQDVPSISFDHAVMEKSNKVTVLPARFDWSDVGNLETFLTLQHQDPTTKATVISVHSEHNIVSAPGKLVALVGVDNLCIIETDDALLITKRCDVEKVKLIVQDLQKLKKQEYL